MGYWRNHGEDHHQHWSRSSSSSYNKNPPLNIRKPVVPRWEKIFCASVGITWSKLVETKKYLCLHKNVMNWDDSACREEFDNAKKRFWASMNDLPCDIPLPDPNIYIDDIDWNSFVDPEFVLDLEKDGKNLIEQQQGEKVLIPGGFTLLNQSFSGSGWGIGEAHMPKYIEFVSSAQVNRHQNNSVNPGTQYYTPYYPHYHTTKNNAWGWNPREHNRRYTYEMGRGVGLNMKTRYEDNREEEKITWHKAPEYPDKINYQIGSKRQNNGGGRGNFAYYHPLGCNAPNA